MPTRLGRDEVAELVQDDERREAERRRGTSSRRRPPALDAGRPRAPRASRVGLVEVLEAGHGRGAGRASSVPLDHARRCRGTRARRRGRRRPRPRWRRSARRARCRRPRRPRGRGAGTGSVSVGRLEGQLADRGEVERLDRHVGALGEVERVGDRDPHVRVARGARATRRRSGWTSAWTIDCGWTTTSIAVVGEPEQVVGLDQLEALVHQRRRVDRDLAAHVPGRMRERLLRRRRSSRSAAAPAERAAGGGQDQPLDASRAARAREELEERRVLGVDRDDPRRRSASASAITSSPPTTRLSLLASARSMPSPSAAIVGPSPAEPTIAFRTRSGSDSRDQVADALLAGQHVARQPGSPGAPPRRRRRRARRGDAGASACASSALPARVGREPDDRELGASGRRRRSPASPIEPVEPRMSTSFTAASVGTSGDRFAVGALSGARPPDRGSRRRARAWNRGGSRSSPAVETIVTSLSLDSKPIALSETSLTTIASIPLRSSLPRARATKSPPCSAAKPTRTWPLRRLPARPARTSAVGSSSMVSPDPSSRASLPGLGSAGRKSATAAAIRRSRRRRRPSPLHPRARRRCHVDALDAGGDRQRDVRGDQRHLGAAPRRRLGEGDAHPAARAIADEADRVDLLTGPAGGDEDAATGQIGGVAPIGRFDRREDLLRLGHPARDRARRARRAPPPRARSPRSRARAGSRRWRRVAAASHIRPFIAGATIRGAVQARNEVVKSESQIPAASFASVFAEAGATTKASARSTTARWEIGSCAGSSSPGIGAAQRVAAELVDQHRGAGDPLERRRADEPCGGVGHRHPDAVAGLRRQPGELDRLVGGDPAADADQDSCHGFLR